MMQVKQQQRNYYSSFPAITKEDRKGYERVMDEMIKRAVANKASDIFFVSGEAPALSYSWKCSKIKLWKADPDTGEIKQFLRINDSFVIYFFRKFIDWKLMKYKYEKELFESQFYTDLSAVLYGVRFRVNVARQMNKFTITMRLISDKIPTVKELSLPSIFLDMTNHSEGLVLVVWPTWSWKSTTLAAILEEINMTKEKHIITLEDPIEYIYTWKKCLIEQKEINQDIVDFPGWVRASLRQKPDIILVGEMRDSETIEAVLKSAETWHLCFSTMHANSFIQTINKIINFFEWTKQLQVRDQLSDFLKAVFVQRLVPKKGWWKVLCLEIWINNIAIANQIRNNELTWIENTISMKRKDWMILFDDYLLELWRKDLITSEVLYEYSHKKESTMKLAEEHAKAMKSNEK